ncbi:MAG TPA: SDR family NAD(P)-dependent oxidoreductase [Caulobacteraceae bacterium]
MNLQGKTILITGATDGLGEQVALMAAKAGANVLLHGRNREKAEPVLEAVKHAGSGGAELYLADLASLDDVRRLAGEVAASHPRLDVLLNNAGVALFGGQPRQLTAGGQELHFQVNYLSHFLLTLLLLPILKASAPARIVNVSSLGHAPIDFDDVVLEHGYTGERGYCQSKLAQIMFTIDLAEALKGAGVTVMALHPATFMNTNMVVGQGLTPRSKVEDGAEATFRLAFGAEHAGETGGFYNQFAPGQPNAQAADPVARRRLWELSEELTGL